MATNPRAGIINLNFKDVSEMAQNIANNDPWKTGIEAAGKVLTDRERYVMYQRALADAQGKERPEDKTAGELIGSGIKTAGKLIGSGIDKLRALMPSETIEKSLTEEVTLKEWQSYLPNYNINDELPWSKIDIGIRIIQVRIDATATNHLLVIMNILILILSDDMISESISCLVGVKGP